MSKKQTVQVACPACKKESDYTIWESVNTAIDPEMKAAVRNRSAFLFTCPECGEKTYVDYSFLYHQMEDRIMIHYANTEENAENIYNLVTGKEMPGMAKDLFDHGYLIRIVRSQIELREKLAIFDAGLDDRIVELFKLYVLAAFQKDNPDCRITELLFFSEGGKHCIQIFADCKPKGTAELTPAVYDILTNDYGPRMPDLRQDGPFIDRQWAMEMLGLGTTANTAQ